MTLFERYWIHAAIYLLLAGNFNNKTIISTVASLSCYAFAVGYFAAMAYIGIKGESK